MRRRLCASAICLAACGRLGFDEAEAPDHGALACGESRELTGLSAVPLGLGLVSIPGGALVAWSQGVLSDRLEGKRIRFDGDRIASLEYRSATLPDEIGEFALAADGDAHFLLLAQVPAGVLLVPLDGDLTAMPPTTIGGNAQITRDSIAGPIDAGAPFVVAGSAGAEAVISRHDAAGAPIGPTLREPGAGAAAIRRTGRRHMVTWTEPGQGCAVWGFDDRFNPLIPSPLVHLPAGACQQPVITRHDAGVNLLAWIAGADAHGQLGTDDTVVGMELSLGLAADALDLTPAPSGFFTAVASGPAIHPGHVRTDATGWRSLRSVDHVPRAPFRLISLDGGALLASIGATDGAPHLQLTRLCE